MGSGNGADGSNQYSGTNGNSSVGNNGSDWSDDNSDSGGALDDDYRTLSQKCECKALSSFDTWLR